MINMIAAFLMSMLLWHLTWGWKHIFINVCIMPFFLKLFGRISFLQTILVSLMSHVCVSGFYISVITIIFVYIIGYEFNNADYMYYLHIYESPIRCALTFAGLYAVLQGIFLLCLQRWIYLSLRAIIAIVLVSNCIIF